ncbi:MAG: DEAD/DEAH box helicase family protein, partial [Persicimonas sp.]
MPSPFTEIPEEDWLTSNELAFAFFDAYPVTEGHTLIVPHRRVATWFDATEEERAAITALIDEVKDILDERFAPDGYNIGINAGEAAGQTVMHLHVHLIPRYHGDMDDPRGGVRHVIPEKGNYLEGGGAPTRPPASPDKVQSRLATGGESDPFIDYLRPLFARAQQIFIVAAFIQDSGLKLLRGPLLSAMARGATVRLLTGDYFHITQVEALRRLLDWQDASELSELLESQLSVERVGEADFHPGGLKVRVVEVGPRDGWPNSFHPKSWRFESDAFGVGFVGSSNISYRALTDGIEWNLSVRRDADPEGYREVAEAFDAQWKEARQLTPEWLAGYELEAKKNPQPVPRGEIDKPEPSDEPAPHEIQREALEALDSARRAGRRRALVVHATGLGKTWLAAFDVRAYAEYSRRTPRVLFLAHRIEILQQAAETFRDIIPDVKFGWFVADKDKRDGDVVFASVQKLRRRARIQQFDKDEFDYVIVDEVHHAAADGYRRILRHLDPEFLLGLTATPDRADEADIRPLFDDFVAHRADIGEGIERGYLCPFHYQG